MLTKPLHFWSLKTIMRIVCPVIFAAATLASGHALASGVLIKGVKDDDLRAEIDAAIPASPNRPETLFDARRRADTAAGVALSVLYANGYYGADIDAQGIETPTPTAVLNIVTGPLFRFVPPRIVFDTADTDPQLRATVEQAATLKNGAPAKGSTVLIAEAQGLASLQAAGYADAETLPREAIADHATNTLAITYHYKTGSRIILGNLRIQGTTRTKPGFIDELTTWKPGDPYKPETLETLARRAADTGIFDSIAPSLAPDETKSATMPANTVQRDVILTLKERKRRTVTLGGSFSTSEGIGVEGSHTWRNLSGKGETVTVATRIAELERALSSEIAYPHWRSPDHTLRLNAELSGAETDAFDQTRIKLSAGVETERRLRLGVGYGVTIDATRVKDALSERDLYIGTLFANLKIDQSDNLLNPTTGFRTDFRVEPVGVLGDAKIGFVKSTVSASAYRKLDKKARLIAAARFKFGSMAGTSLTNVPADYRFFAGGGGSVRGFEHQALSPRAADIIGGASGNFVAFGGRSLFESSFELRWRATPNWGAVAFIDAGSAGDNPSPDFSKVRAGAGIGLRYFTDFGPLRFDLATPLDARAGESDLQFYVSIGQSF